ncbi:hypothetical protein J7E62_22670 [Variovorax paradoxus]|nr:hypothetical protein [Variovorax paradoxus]
MSKTLIFVYRGYHFLCTSEKEGPARFRPVLLRQLGWPIDKLVDLLSDSDLCRTEAEALRHAEQQAMKWADARTTAAVP